MNELPKMSKKTNSNIQKTRRKKIQKPKKLEIVSILPNAVQDKFKAIGIRFQQIEDDLQRTYIEIMDEIFNLEKNISKHNDILTKLVQNKEFFMGNQQNELKNLQSKNQSLYDIVSKIRKELTYHKEVTHRKYRRWPQSSYSYGSAGY